MATVLSLRVLAEVGVRSQRPPFPSPEYLRSARWLNTLMYQSRMAVGQTARKIKPARVCDTAVYASLRDDLWMYRLRCGRSFKNATRYNSYADTYYRYSVRLTSSCATRFRYAIFVFSTHMVRERGQQLHGCVTAIDKK